MVVTTGVNGEWNTAQSSSLSEVRSHLNAEMVNGDQLIEVMHDGTDYVAWYYKG